jgi:hypothetical protein
MWGLVFLLSASGLKAQSVADDTEQLLLDVQKLTQMKEILSEMYQGYQVLHSGFEEIKGLSEGTFSLHKTFLDALLAVSPAVQAYWKVGDIVEKEVLLVRECKTAGQYLGGTGQFTSVELGVFLDRWNGVIQGSLNNVSALLMIMTGGNLRMSDAQRLEAIDRIDGDVSRMLGNTRAMDDAAAVLAAQRAVAQQGTVTVGNVYGIRP